MSENHGGSISIVNLCAGMLYYCEDICKVQKRTFSGLRQRIFLNKKKESGAWLFLFFSG